MNTKTLKLLLLFTLCVFSFGLFSQTPSATSIKKNCRYTFNGELSSQTKTEIENNVAKLQFVTSAKIKYKADSKAGELILSVEEKQKTTEGEETGFNIFELKQLLLSYNITPLEFNVLKN